MQLIKQIVYFIVLLIMVVTIYMPQAAVTNQDTHDFSLWVSHACRLYHTAQYSYRTLKLISVHSPFDLHLYQYLHKLASKCAKYLTRSFLWIIHLLYPSHRWTSNFFSKLSTIFQYHRPTHSSFVVCSSIMQSNFKSLLRIEHNISIESSV